MVKPLPLVNQHWPRRAVLFDLDGVLVDATSLHRLSLRQAVSEATGRLLTPSQERKLEGLPTAVKLPMLADWGIVPADALAAVGERKQQLTRLLIDDCIKPDPGKAEMLRFLGREGYALGVVSNAIGASVTRMLQMAGLMWPLGIILSNEDVTRPKPAPDGWIIAMYELGARPENTLIVEDSAPGIASGHASGARVLEVKGPEEVTLERVRAAL